MSNDNNSESGPLFGAAVTAARDNVDASDVIFSPRGSQWETAQAVTLKLNWNRVFPYQFLIMERVGGKWQRANGPGIPGALTLPVPPQNLGIDMAFASTVEATQGGVIEQNNGAPFRDITLSGTTGVLPLRGVTDRPTGFNFAQGLFAGTVNAAQSALSGINAVRKTATLLTRSDAPANVNADASFEASTPDSLGFSTGYYQFLLLKRFMEWYAEAKKRKDSQNLALGFAVWKEQEVYLVTPLKFSVQRQAGKGLHYMYSIALKAWRRVTMIDSGIGKLAHHSFVARDPNAYAQALSFLEGARRTLENGKKILGAVRGDVNNIVFGTLRQVALFVKDAVGAGLAVADLNIGLVNDFKEPLLEKIGATGLGAMPSTADIVKSLSLRPDTLLQDKALADAIEDLKLHARKAQKNKTRSGRPESGPLDATLDTLQAQNSVPLVFVDPRQYFEFWSQIRADSLNLRPSTVAKIADAREAVRNLRREDFEQFRDDLLAVAQDFSAAVGVGDPTVSAVYGLPTRAALRATPTDADWEILGALNDAAQQMDAFAASSSINRENNISASATDYVAGLAQASGVAFTTPKSKFLVPFPYGYTLEQLANQYLGNPDRWIEIATLNGLRAPYVDEVGRTHDLVSNGTGNQISVPTAAGYYVGQQVWITALGVKREKRRITRIDTLSPTVTLLSLSGEGDLHRFTLAKEAFVQSFLPETVNSLQYLYIPSDDEVETDWQTRSIPGVDTFDPLFRVGGADLMLTSDGDLAITSDGTTRLAVGLTNLIQRVRIAVATPQGSLLRHPEFGFGVSPGTSTSDVTASQVLAAAKNFVKNEEGFDGVDYAAVNKSGGTLTLSMSVKIAGVGKTIPINVTLR